MLDESVTRLNQKAAASDPFDDGIADRETGRLGAGILENDVGRRKLEPVGNRKFSVFNGTGRRSFGKEFRVVRKDADRVPLFETGGMRGVGAVHNGIAFHDGKSVRFRIVPVCNGR